MKEWMKRFRESKIIQYSVIPVMAFLAYLQFYTIEMSFSTADVWVEIPLMSKLVGICTVLFLDTVMLLILKNIRIAMNISICLTTILAVVNYYVTKFRGTPFTFVLIQNFTTAMNVISSYSFKLDDRICTILGNTVIQLVVVNLLYCRTRIKRRYSAPAVLCLLAMMYLGYMAPNPVIPHNVVGWSWRVSVKSYGYLPCMIKCTIESTNSVRMPENYNEQQVEEFVKNYQIENQGGNTPDIIVILNETFYDLDRAIDLKTDIDPLEYIHSLDNSIQGYCYSPCEGGGTNISEYELLTSNSIYLSPNSNPFNTIDISGGNSFATYLESLGYTSFAAHSEPGLNYARDAAYPALGFDEIHFEEDFEGQEFYYGRLYETDACLYENLIRWYEEMDEGPRVMYLLTIQNHANFNYLNEKEYLVRVEGDYGELTGQINEFLTCIQLSDQAFEILVEYFENVDRDVIICMVGDHAPIFVGDLVSDEYTGQDWISKTCAVPYVIWSNNIDLSETGISKEICMPYIVPKVMQIGGVKLSAYYDYIVQLQEQVPFITSYGTYVDTQGTNYTFHDETQFTQMLERYFDLAYANMTKAGFMMQQQ